MSRFDDFIERLEAALEDEEGREAFVNYLQEMTPQERAELLAEAERRDPDGASELAQAMLDAPENGRPGKAQTRTASKPVSKKKGRHL